MESLFGVDLPTLVQGVGYVGLFAIIFAESGVFVGFFLPGDSLLFTVGVLASQGYFSLPVLLPLLTLAAVLGDSFGYWFGRVLGRELYQWEDRWYFKKEYLTRTEHFFARFGTMAVVIARFVPVVRTFVPILAGAGEMRYSTFVAANIAGAVLWACGVTLLGYLFGSIIPNPDRYIIPALLVIVATSFIPAITAYVGSLRKKV